MLPVAPIEHEVKGITYRVGRLSAMQQMHVSRKISPLLAGLAPALGVLNAKTAEEQLAALKPFADALAGLADADAEYVMCTCLGIVRRDLAGSGKDWGPLYRGTVSSCDDLGLDVLVPLVVFVIRQSLGPFIADYLTSAPGVVEPPTA